ncbi:uncharacterized protein SPPG_00766 [Spizellomyces punctatus DAOM BR117]|uniref:DUF4200 domain-containing protein n=1 Tax=Spizellomyces punctatus (strain DAOM BR117) TaxID=645134 RepID=A0A0L0HVJ4_SPIPD|nr:uncharacterized protein SPPG_00766 [Spizellomyces punctatus DAOM BR117]KND05092.1 hypothetical protein SPPG_00766 [Spizellomyces punctatus DAOM BR117]|eukprot:XP_016613131.1 hypothetical protein SPPG_00766 [Spizellomyces punctatus DAOM BR117]
MASPSPGITFSATVRPATRMRTPAPPPVVEHVTEVEKKEGETFVTQRGGKIIQPIIPNDRPATHFATRHTLQSTLLLQKKKEMQSVQSQLEKKRLDFARRMEECREKQEELKAKQKQIRDRVTKFEKFLKENDAKRQRANAKAQAERKLREQKEQELYTLTQTLHTEQTKHNHTLHLIQKYQIYETYLQSVVDLLPPDYLDIPEPHINDILMRHKTLLETSQDLSKTVSDSTDEMERVQTILVELVKEKNDLILVYNSTLGTLQKRLDRLKQECAYLEQRLEERDNTGKERMRMLSETKLAINNIYDRVGLRPHQQTQHHHHDGGAPPQGTTHIMPQQPQQELVNIDNSAKALAERLHAIQDRVLDLQHIAQRAEQFLTQDRVEKAKRQAALAAESTSFKT